MKRRDGSPAAEVVLRGIPAAAGIARGPVIILRSEDEDAPSYSINEEDIGAEIARLEQALLSTRAQILETQTQIATAIGAHDAAIFDAHLLVVEDQTLIEEVVKCIREDLQNAEQAFGSVAERYAKTLSEIDDTYLRERAVDIRDVTRRVIRNLLGRERETIDTTHPYILVAEDLTPADTVALDRALVLGFATEAGSGISHTAIMARSLGIPAVVGLRGALHRLRTGDEALLDGKEGKLILHPAEATLADYGQRETALKAVEQTLEGLRDTESRTRDGKAIVLSANIELTQEVHGVKEHGARGVGLYRTEFFFLNRSGLPDEEEQTENYLAIARALHPDPLIIRTLDVGGDKLLPRRYTHEEENPFLGWRAIRFCLEETAIFKTQLRAILRASTAGNVKMMYPMISGIEEFRLANRLLEECRGELRREGLAFAEDMDVGAMIEVPTAAICADILAREARFFSIGTNDLIQYSTAVDRVNQRVAGLYKPAHPAIVRLLHGVVEAAHAAGIWVGLCGEMAGEIAYTPLLIGLGIDELSTGASLVPRVKRAVQTLDTNACRALVRDALSLETTAEIVERTTAMARECYPELLG